VPSGKRIAVVGLAVALLATVLVVFSQTTAPARVAVAKPPAPQSTAFAGASAERIFLTAADRNAAARAGLVPADTRSILRTGGQLKHGEWRWDSAGVPPASITVRVDLERQMVSVFQGPDEIGTAVIVYGAENKETPRGKLPIRGKSRDYHSRTYDAPMPFSLWLREDGVAIHGSTVASGRATNGCIGVPVPFAEKLFAVAEKGDVVEVIG
jgi:lipoprotein-anchoring transpeptidase ErfK/SrfK